VLVSKWDDRFIQLAKTVSTWSKDPSTGVGAVIVDWDNRIVSLGFNGFPRGIKDDERLESREIKYETTIHAEVNAILFSKRDLSGCTLYVWPIPPCSRCSSIIVQSGIARVVSVSPPEHWQQSCELGKSLLEEAGVAYYLTKEV
jgi:dCMP deaminase